MDDEFKFVYFRAQLLYWTFNDTLALSWFKLPKMFQNLASVINQTVPNLLFKTANLGLIWTDAMVVLYHCYSIASVQISPKLDVLNNKFGTVWLITKAKFWNILGSLNHDNANVSLKVQYNRCAMKDTNLNSSSNLKVVVTIWIECIHGFVFTGNVFSWKFHSYKRIGT